MSNGFDPAAHLLSEFKDLGNRVRQNLWRPEDEAFLRMIATNIAGLTGKLASATDPAKKQRFEENIRLLGNHVAVMAFSRANVVERDVGETILRVLTKAVDAIIGLVLARIGLK